jgi:L-ascorbate metabolism protein UlaG (beta-lactamase superfamily)
VNYVGHATVLVDIGRIRILTDPILRDRVFFLQRHGDNPAPDLLSQRKPDVVLLSHLHYDHADLPSLRRLAPTTPVLAPRGSGRYLKRWAGVEVEEMVEGETLRIADVEITALPANHGPYFSQPRPATSCLSYALRNRLSVYFAGDTDLFAGMKEVGQEFDLDVALLPVWGYSHRLGPGHLNPFTAAQAVQQLRPKVAVPIHWGALRLPGPNALWDRAPHMSIPPRDFATHTARLAPDTEVRILQPGDWTQVH